MDQLAETLGLQHGVIARRQLRELGLSNTHIAKVLRRRELVPIHPGVYVDHTGPVTWHQRAWAAVLYAWPAALSHESALRAAGGPGHRTRDETLIHLAVDRQRHLDDIRGVRLHRMANFSQRVQWNRAPPRVRYDDSVLDVASADTDDLDSVAVLAAACGARRTTASRLLSRLDTRSRVARREWLSGVLTDVAQGTCSVLEHGYQARVVRPHGLPRGHLQAVHLGANGSIYRDVDHQDLGLVVELDGRLFHTSVADRDRDLERDLDVVVDRDATTVRLGFGQVFTRGCATAAKLGAVMTRLGWTGRPVRCHLCGAQDQPG